MEQDPQDQKAVSFIQHLRMPVKLKALKFGAFRTSNLLLIRRMIMESSTPAILSSCWMWVIHWVLINTTRILSFKSLINLITLRFINFVKSNFSSPTKTKFFSFQTVEDKQKRLSYDVHFWLGLETTQDESGAAAILTVQLDDQLNGAPIQHREVQEQEGQLFKSYFSNGISYLPGGVASGFRKTETNAAGEKRLFQVKGKKNIRVRQVDISIGSMNKGDCFILDNGREIYIYVGPKTNRIEKMKANSMANQIRDQDHNGRAVVHIVGKFVFEFSMKIPSMNNFFFRRILQRHRSRKLL